jgi:hypothetical protein
MTPESALNHRFRRSCPSGPALFVPRVESAISAGQHTIGVDMPNYVALTYTADVDWSHPDQAAEMREYNEFGKAAAAVIRGGAALYPTATATTVRTSGKGGDVVASDGPYAETKEALTGFYLFECADLDEAIAWAGRLPAAWDGAVEVRPLIDFG